MPSVAQRLTVVREKLAQAAWRSGREPEEITLVAVSKMHPASQIQEAINMGQQVFGESYLQEAVKKASVLPSHLRWHLIGHLQTNKIRGALGLFSLIHGVHSLALARNVDKIAGEKNVLPRLLLEVNISGETSKFGFTPGALEARMEELLSLQRVRIDGLMTVAPYTPDPESSRRLFSQLREYRDHLARKVGTPLGVLSMGMSGDYQVAIEEGATLVRVGGSIFGGRRAR
ncbi:MAG: YggS family pyridoxal phosphate-dependent enzyme [Candidatus Xiphinematobacter sp.]|nr:MAG: YggS family pyridoxal phosphate-dependent enzyme [Candidatus Xiphinematobacter sp.]QQY08549.1 MAG: YggS family pyridoxal phosphate-dependent enzyme [Candidatus Xiphinematobacter sp.]QQY09285.1 MAG: YggS family pyridoxal phosphate-dependent enzyme [Candidatus Xiphinematobacter sp.]QQY10037.1 MAG: YggS family pyridoxal phosphate-dependent enzyme [Candidatus Xiphinematobacter sp.]QQY10769.1 MAG: YggS family pyridoxal phosphate-dependent enzyme [Candidatus Xiphinematobacter sp.]